MSNNKKDKIPEIMYLVFQEDLFLGAFVERENAQKTKEARERGGFKCSEVIPYFRLL